MPNEAEIVKHLFGKLSPEVILLGGSRASGTETPISDWDLYLIGNYTVRDSFPEQFLGEHLDVEVRPRSEVPGDVLSIYYGPVPSLKVLKDSSDQLGVRVVEQTRQAYERGPGRKSPEELALSRSEMARMAAKIAAHASDPEACFTNLGFFHRMSIQYWFEKMERWSLPPHKALPIIRREDPKFAQILAVLSGGQSMQDKVRACTKIQESIWGV